MNAEYIEYIKKGMPQAERLQELRRIARYQLASVSRAPGTKRLEESIKPPDKSILQLERTQEKRLRAKDEK